MATTVDTSLYKLNKNAFAILSGAFAKMTEIASDAIDAVGSPKQPKLEAQLIHIGALADQISAHVILNAQGTAIVGIKYEDVDVINALLMCLRDIAGLGLSNHIPFPLIPIENDLCCKLYDVGPPGTILVSNGTEYVPVTPTVIGSVPTYDGTTTAFAPAGGSGLPAGGLAGQVLKKNSNTSYDVVWAGLTLSDITDVTSNAAELNALDGLNTGAINFNQFNTLVGINTGLTIQQQLDAKMGNLLDTGKFLVGNLVGVAAPVTPTGDVTFTSAGVFNITAGAIVNVDINASAGIARSKLANGGFWKIVINNGSGVMTDGNAITGDRALISDINGIPIHSGTGATQLGHISTLASNAQDQLNQRLTVNLTSPVQGDMIQFDGTDWVNFAVGTAGQVLTSDGTSVVWGSAAGNGLPSGGTTAQVLRKIDNADYNTEWHTLLTEDITDITATAAELNIMDGVTVGFGDINSLTGISGNVQTQLDSKLPKALAYNAMYVGDISNFATQLAPGTNGQVLTSVGGVPQWVTPAGGGNIYNIDGTLTGDRTVDGGGFELTFNNLGVLFGQADVAIIQGINVAGISSTTGPASISAETDVSIVSNTAGIIMNLVGGLAINTDEGTAGHVLTSAGPGAPPVWAAGGGGGANIYNTDGTLTGDRILNGNGDNLTFTDLGAFTLGHTTDILTPIFQIRPEQADTDSRNFDLKPVLISGFIRGYVFNVSSANNITPDITGMFIRDNGWVYFGATSESGPHMIYRRPTGSLAVGNDIQNINDRDFIQGNALGNNGSGGVNILRGNSYFLKGVSRGNIIYADAPDNAATSMNNLGYNLMLGLGSTVSVQEVGGSILFGDNYLINQTTPEFQGLYNILMGNHNSMANTHHLFQFGTGLHNEYDNSWGLWKYQPKFVFGNSNVVPTDPALRMTFVIANGLVGTNESQSFTHLANGWTQINGTNDGFEAGGATMTEADVTPQAVLDVVSADSAVLITRAAEASITTPVDGMINYNITTNKFRGYENGAWQDLVGGGGGNIYNTDGTLTANRTVSGDSFTYNLSFEELNAFGVEVDADFGVTYGTLVSITGPTPADPSIIMDQSTSTVQMNAGDYTAGPGNLYGALTLNLTAATLWAGDGTDVGTVSVSSAGFVALSSAGDINMDLAEALLINGTPGTSGYVLTSQGAGTPPIWAAAGGGGGSPGGVNTEVQLNNSGSFGGAGIFVTNPSYKTIILGNPAAASGGIVFVGAEGSETDVQLYMSSKAAGAVTLISPSGAIELRTGNAPVSAYTDVFQIRGQDDLTPSSVILELGGYPNTTNKILGPNGSAGTGPDLNGGGIQIIGGNGHFSGDGNSGGILLKTGAATGAGTEGNITLEVVNGFVVINGLPSSTPGGTNRLWKNSGALAIT